MKQNVATTAWMALLGLGLAVLTLSLTPRASAQQDISSQIYTESDTPPATAPAATPQPAAPPALSLFYIGNRYSSIEPCGCHSKQQGGVQFESTLYDTHQEAPALRFDAGDWTYARITDMPLEALKTRYLLRAMTQMQLDAVNIGAADMQLSAEFFKNYAEKNPNAIPNFVSGNVFWKDRPATPAFATSRTTERTLTGGQKVTIGITGAADLRQIGTAASPAPTNQTTALTIGDFVAKPPIESLQPIIAALRAKVDLLVVLYTGDFASSLELAKAYPQIDFLITTGQAAHTSLLAQPMGPVTILSVRNINGKELGQAGLDRNSDGRWKLQTPPQMLAVGRDVKPKPALLDLIAAFKKETESLDAQTPKSDVPRIYAGANACSDCHATPYQQWASTPHAHALQTLVDKDQQFNPECLKCHTVGFRQANGFYSVKHEMSRPMYHVQCENCHGPAKEHAEAQRLIQAGASQWMKPEELKAVTEKANRSMPRRAVPEKVCLECHTPSNDNNFVYATKVQKVNHTTAAGTAQATPAGQGQP